MKIKINGDGSLKCDGTHYFYLNNFSIGTSSSVEYHDYSVSVQVLVDGSVVTETTAADNETGKYWGIISIAADGTISTLNTFNDNCTTTGLGLPVDNAARCASVK